MGINEKYYPRKDFVREVARELDIPFYQAKDFVDVFFEILIDRLSDADKVEIRLYNGLSIISKYSPITSSNLKDSTRTNKDKMVRLSLKPSKKFKTLLYEMNKDKELGVYNV